MNRSTQTLFAAAVVAVAALAFWLVQSGADRSVPAISSDVEAAARSNAPDRDEVAPVEVRAEPSRDAVTPEESLPAMAAEQESSPALDAREDEKFDSSAKDPLAIRVVDPEGSPVPDASVTISGMRSAGSTGGWFSYRGTEPKGVTDANGELSLAVFRWVNIDGKTSGVDLNVVHPEFAPFRDSSFKLDAGTVVLERGATVVVTGWVGSETNVVQDVLVNVDRKARLGEDAWVRLGDGRLSTSQLLPGPHRIMLKHEHPELGTLQSAVEAIEVKDVGWAIVHLELLPSVDLVGELDISVPRPVVNGHVELTVRTGGENRDDPVLAMKHEAEVREDGSFTISNVMRGDGFVLAVCEGWASKPQRPTTLQDFRMSLSANASPERAAEALERAIASADEYDYVLPTTPLPQLDPSFAVPMQATGSVVVTVVDSKGAPISGASVNVSPNYRTPSVGARIVPWFPWNTGTGDDGVGTISNLPADPSLWVGVSADGYQMKAEDRDRAPSVKIVPGQATELIVELERSEDD